MPDTPASRDRTVVLRQIEATYAEYERTGRERLWDQRSRGFAYLVSALRSHVLRDLRRSLVDNEAIVLDLGCGTGELAAQAGAYGVAIRWLGLDLRADAISVARAANPEATFIVASADAIPLPRASVDVVVAQVLFSSIPSTEMELRVAREIERVLRPGGWLIWMDLRYPNPRNPAIHPLARSRIEALFPGWRAELRTVGLLPPIARALGMTASVSFPILAGIPLLRSHLVGRLERPRLSKGR